LGRIALDAPEPPDSEFRELSRVRPVFGLEIPARRLS
jgi:hypothetical protein